MNDNMRINLKFRFNSGSLLAYFIISAIGFVILYVIIWTLSVRAERIANLRHDVLLIMNGISGSIVGTAELDSQGLQDQSQSLMQEYLNFTFDFKKSQSQERVAKVSVYFLNPERQLIGEWLSPDDPPRECLENRTEYFQPARSPYPYLVELTINTCSINSLGLFEYHSISLPIIVSLAVILFWGICIFAMLHSIRYAGKLLEQTEDVDELLEKTDKIYWLNVRILAQKAVQVRGKNLQFYQTLILDAQHDIAKILDAVSRKYNEQDLNYNVSSIRGIMQRLAIEIRSSNELYQELNSYKDLNSEEILQYIRTHFLGCEIINSLPKNLIVSISDISIFERIIVNLSSNAIKHSVSPSKIKIFYANDFLSLRVHSPVSFFSALNIHFAKLTNRIDLKNIDSPVFFRFFGRSGRGLSIIKRGIIKLKGKMFFTIESNIVETGFDIPAELFQDKILEIPKISKKRKKVIFFKNDDFIKSSIEYGLEDFLINQAELNELISSTNKGEKVEVVSDEDINLPESFILRLITKKERIEGLALNWIGDSK
jgi:signal transduction histidine kinase